MKYGTTGHNMDRVYTHKDGKLVLLSWIQKRCKCGRFLSKRQLKLCAKCAGPYREYNTNYHRIHRRNK